MGKRITVTLVLLALCAVSCSEPAAVNTPLATSVAPTPIASGANGKLVPRQFVELGVKSSGAVAEVLVREGEQVQIGQTLARLDDTLFKLAVEEARLKLEQAGLDSEKAQKPADPVELAAAEKKIQAAQVALVNARGTLSTTVDSAQSALRSAQLAFDYAEADYNHQLDLKQWGIDVEVKVNALQASRVRYDNAHTDLEIARRDVSGAGIRASQAIVEAQKTLASAQADYDALKKRPEPEKVRTAQLAVESAKVALAQVEADLQEATLVAPITGMVVEVNLKVGQQVGPGVTLITLADTGAWLVETANLTELSVVDIKPGSRAICKFDAVPGLRLPGRVERIALRGQDQRGDVIYTVHVALDEMDSRLRWGMTAFVQFEK